MAFKHSKNISKNAQARALVYSSLNNLIKAMVILDALIGLLCTVLYVYYGIKTTNILWILTGLVVSICMVVFFGVLVNWWTVTPIIGPYVLRPANAALFMLLIAQLIPSIVKRRE